ADVLQRGAQTQHQRSRRRERRVAGDAAFGVRLQAEVEIPVLGGLLFLPGLLADGSEGQAGRNHHGLLRAADHDVQSPAVDIERHGAKARNGVNDKQRIGLGYDLAHRLDVVRHTGGRFAGLHEDAFDVGIFFERFLNLLRLNGRTVGFFDDDGFQAKGLGQLGPTLAELAGLADDDFLARAEQVRDRGFHGPRTGRGEPRNLGYAALEAFQVV